MSQQPGDGWNYFRDTIENVGTDLETLFGELESTAISDGIGITVTEVGLGVTADMAGVEVVSLAAFLLLGEYATGWVVRWVGQLFPNPSILGWHPLGFISDGLQALGNQFITSAQGLGDELWKVFTQPIRVIMGLFQRLGNATSAAHTKVAHLYNHTIPDAVSGVVGQANGYTDTQVTKVEGDLKAAEANLNGNITTNVTAAEAQAKADLAAAEVNLNANIQANVAAAESQAQAGLSQLQATLVARLQGDEQAIAMINQLVTVQVPAEVATAVSDAVSSLTQSFQTALTTLNTQLQTQLNQMTQAIEQQDQTAISTLHQQILATSSQITQLEKQQQLNTAQLAPYEAPGATFLPLVLAALAGSISKLTTQVDTCTIDTCDPTKPNNIMNVLKDLLGMLTAAGEIGFIAEAAKDPIGTANALAPILNGIDLSATDTLNALLSL